MSGERAIGAPAFRAAMLAAGDAVCAARDELGTLDAAAGDGDLGATLALGFGFVRDALEQGEATDVGALLVETGGQLARKAPSTIGALLGTAFLRAGAALRGVSALGASEACELLSVACAAVAERGGAALGQRTVVDALDGSARAAAAAAASGGSVQEVLRAAARGAAESAEATASMEPHFGRAAWIADRARGVRDAGAVAWATYLGALAEACDPQQVPARA